MVTVLHSRLRRPSSGRSTASPASKATDDICFDLGIRLRGMEWKTSGNFAVNRNGLKRIISISFISGLSRAGSVQNCDSIFLWITLSEVKSHLIVTARVQ